MLNNKNMENYKDLLQSQGLLNLLGITNIDQLSEQVFGNPNPPTPKNNHIDLKNGFYLKPIETLENNTEKYSYLYKDGVKTSNNMYRKGGISNGFKDGFCHLIRYKKVKKTKNNKQGIDFGTHVIIGEDAEIKLSEERGRSMYHLGGCLATMDRYIYNLNTGEKIAERGDSTMKSSEFLFVECIYSHNHEFKNGVYKIRFDNGEVEFFEKTR